MAVHSNVLFHGASGSLAGNVLIVSLSGLQPGSGNRIGFFSTGYGAPVITGAYPDSTFITNHDASAISYLVNNELLNNKFINSTTVNHDSNPSNSGVGALKPKHATFRTEWSFPGGTAATIQNAFLYIVPLNAASGVSGSINNIVRFNEVRALEISGLPTTQWSNLAGATASTNRLALTDRTASKTSHSWHIAMSASPREIKIHRDMAILVR